MSSTAEFRFNHRLTLAADWNSLIRAGCLVAFRQFAARHGLRPETWRREYGRGATGCTIPDGRGRRRRKYAGHDPFKARDEIGRKSRRYVVELVGHVAQDDVGCGAYYTRTCASREKGSVENCNRLVGRWHPKGTDFGKCTCADMHRLEDAINSIRRRMSDGKAAYEYNTAYNKAA